jgi:polysaccharide biosynthesis transport protein
MREVHEAYSPVAFVTGALRRHLLLILVLTLLGAAAGVAGAVRQGIQYTATASILLNPLEGNPFAPDGRGEQLVNLETEAQLVRTEGVAALVSRELKTDLSTDELHEVVEVENPANTQVLRISFTADSRSEAIRGAEAFAESYLDYRGTRAKSLTNSRLARIRKQQSNIQTALGDATDELGKTDEGSARHAYLEERVSALASQIASLETEVSTLTATDLVPGQVISPATAPLTAGGTNAVLFGGAGAIAGLALGAMLALFRTRADDRLLEPGDVERLDLRLLGVIGDRERFAGRRERRGRGLPEPYRELRTAVVGSVAAPPVVLTVTSLSPDVSSAPEAAGLATGLARAGFSVVLVDTAGAAGELLTGTQSLPGLAELLAGSGDLRHLLVQPDDNLVLLPFGRPQRTTMDQLLSPQMRSTVGQLREWYDYVLLTGQPVTTADGQALAALTDAVVLVAARKQTTRTELQNATALLARHQSAAVGAIVIDGRPGKVGDTGPASPAPEASSVRPDRPDRPEPRRSEVSEGATSYERRNARTDPSGRDAASRGRSGVSGSTARRGGAATSHPTTAPAHLAAGNAAAGRPADGWPGEVNGHSSNGHSSNGRTAATHGRAGGPVSTRPGEATARPGDGNGRARGAADGFPSPTPGRSEPTPGRSGPNTGHPEATVRAFRADDR